MKKQYLGKNADMIRFILPEFAVIVINPAKGARIVSCYLADDGNVIALQDKAKKKVASKSSRNK